MVSKHRTTHGQRRAHAKKSSVRQVCRSAIHREREQLKVTMGHMNRRKVVRTDDDTRSED